MRFKFHYHRFENGELPFGKYKGRHFSAADLGYLRWMLMKAKTADAGSVLVDFIDEFGGDIREHIERVEREQLESAAVGLDLTDHQTTVAEQVLDCLRASRMARLEGGAGYGKSYTTAYVLVELRREGRPVKACAVSYVATQVLRQNLNPFGFEARTIASLLGLSKVVNGATESYEITDESYEKIDDIFRDGGVLLVDEYSMVNDEIADFIVSACEKSGDGMLIAVGDLKQLPPVKQDTYSSFAEHIPHGSTLTRPMRYSEDSVLYQVEKTARENPWTLNPNDFAGEEVLVCRDVTAGLDAMIESMALSPELEHRALFFTRRDVVEANNYVRSSIYGSDRAHSEPVIEDEKLMVLATMDYRETQDPDVKAIGRFYSGTTFSVSSVQRAERVIRIGAEEVTIPCYQVLKDDVWLSVIFSLSDKIADPSKHGSAEFTAALKKAAEHAAEQEEFGVSRREAWSAYWFLHSTFLKVGYSYATTLHRAQGASLDVVLVDPWRIPPGSPLLRNALAYVGLTRARKRLILTAK